MKKKWENYAKDLAEKICDFYVENRTICLERYARTQDPQLADIYETADEDEVQAHLTKTSVVILTANKYEKNALHDSVYGQKHSKIKRFPISLFPQRENGQETFGYFFTWHGYEILHVEAQTTGSYTIGGAADVVRYLLDNPWLYPTAIISLGICFGVDEDTQKIGQTFISEKIYPYFMGAKWDEHGFAVSDNNMFAINSKLHSEIKTRIIDTNRFSGLGFDAKFGNFITGEAVISNKDVRDLLLNITTQEVAAGEMEGYGVFKECRGRNVVLPCLIIKAICDWGVLKNICKIETAKQVLEDHAVDVSELNNLKDTLQAYAAYNAVSTLSVLLQEGIFHRSIYEDVNKKIQQKRQRERSIYWASILEYMKESAGNKLGAGKSIAIDFVNACIRTMESEGLLSLIASEPHQGEQFGPNSAWTINKRK